MIKRHFEPRKTDIAYHHSHHNSFFDFTSYSASEAFKQFHWLSLGWVNSRAHLQMSSSPAEEVSSTRIQSCQSVLGAEPRSHVTPSLGNQSWPSKMHLPRPTRRAFFGVLKGKFPGNYWVFLLDFFTEKTYICNVLAEKKSTQNSYFFLSKMQNKNLIPWLSRGGPMLRFTSVSSEAELTSLWSVSS